MITRRAFLAVAGAFALAQPRGDGHVTAAIKPPTIPVEPGEHRLGLSSERDGLLVVPRGYRRDTPTPLAVMLHGAGGSSRRVSALFSVATELNVVLLVPESRGATWDAIRDRFGPDVDFLSRAVAHTVERCAIDRRRVAIGGFSDGASYALSIGLASGDFFTHVLAFSPGFIAPSAVRGRPRIFVSHGTSDDVLPINRTSRRIVPELQNAGYQVKYREFDGPHAVPPAIAREGFDWFLAA